MNAIIFGDERWSFDQVDDVSNRLANQLLDADLGEGRRVAVFAANAPETVLTHLGALFGGAATVPVNFHLTASEAEFIVRDSGARLLFVGPETVERGVEVAQRCGIPVIAWRCRTDLASPAVRCEDWLGTASAAPPPSSVEPRPSILYTSGTTGVPKGVEAPPAMFPRGKDVAEHLELARSNRFARFGMHLVAGPLYHTGPLQAIRLLALRVPLTVLARFDAEAVLAAIESHRVETSVMVPTHFVRLLALPKEVRYRYDVSSLRLVSHTGAACPVTVKRAMLDWWGPVLLDAYGATEVGVVCSITAEEWLAHPGSVGRALTPYTAVVVDEQNRPVGPGVEGKLYFRDASGRGIVYPGDEEKTRAAHLEPGVFTLGEVGYVDEDGYVFLTDRFSDLVVSGGANLYPAEAEMVLIQHPAVADVAVIGVPDDDMGEVLKALVVVEDGAALPDSQELIDFCRARLTSMKCPRSVAIVPTLHRTAVGKLNKRQLRSEYGGGAPSSQ